MPDIAAFAAQSPTSDLAETRIHRSEPAAHEVAIDIEYCGVCHSDLHTARDDWGGTKYPCVPGHEIVGRVVKVGSAVSKFAVGQRVGVGCMVDSCQTCSSCEAGLEQYCETGMTGTYNGSLPEGGYTFGGYSKHIVVRQEFVLSIADTLDPAAAAPLLCAGITTYSPLRHWGVKAGDKVGVVGLGGLGHMAMKLAVALGAEVTLFTTSPGKAEDAKALGASRVVISKDRAQMKAVRGELDFILNTVAAPHQLDPYLMALSLDGVMVMVGLPDEAHPAPGMGPLIMKRRSLAGSLIGGIKETQDMLDFCAEHGIVSDIEMIRMDEINTAYERMLKSDVKYRFVIDMATL